MTEKQQQDEKPHETLEQKWSNRPGCLYRYFHLEQASPFDCDSGKNPDRTPIVAFYQLHRSVGMVEGTLCSFDPETHTGEIEIEGQRFACRCRRRKRVDFSQQVGLKARFSFWPSISKISFEKNGAEDAAIKELHLSNALKMRGGFSQGYVESIGKLARMWSGGFEIWVWSRSQGQRVRTVFSGDYPYPDELGNYIWVTGCFEPATGTIRFKEASAIDFLSREERQEFLDQLEKSKQEKAKRREQDLANKARAEERKKKSEQKKQKAVEDPKNNEQGSV